ncbi:unnamed protein product [Schistocephalus solidus]|uniref:Uncharacterized protein n=1 Tax=Schistocephalus solidus TaxID=70667 RepID=A0A183SSG9_SCHSO|nr:unnamed protein product [Schistocephalus solidus]
MRSNQPGDGKPSTFQTPLLSPFLIGRSQPSSTDFSAAAGYATLFERPGDSYKRECTSISWSEVATHAAQTGHVFNFDAAESVDRGDDHTTRQMKEAWMSTDCSVNRQINQPAPYLGLRHFLLEDRCGMEHPGPPNISAANVDGG